MRKNILINTHKPEILLEKDSDIILLIAENGKHIFHDTRIILLKQEFESAGTIAKLFQDSVKTVDNDILQELAETCEIKIYINYKLIFDYTNNNNYDYRNKTTI